MQYEIVKYGRSELRVRSQEVAQVDEAIRRLASDMLQTMYGSRGLGLAAQQVGRSEALCVIDIPQEAHDSDPERGELPLPPMPLVLINPRITVRDGKQNGQEGCLSFPDIFVNVARAKEVTVEFLDREGRPQSVQACGLLARAIQHELDHLDGVLLVDRMSAVQKVAQAGKLKRLKKESRQAVLA